MFDASDFSGRTLEFCNVTTTYSLVTPDSDRQMVQAAPILEGLVTHAEIDDVGQPSRALRCDSNVYSVSKLYTMPGAAVMRTNIEIDDKLMAQAMRLTGLSTKRAAVEEGLRLLVRIRKQAKALKALEGLGWEGDLDEMRQGRRADRS